MILPNNQISMKKKSFLLWNMLFCFVLFERRTFQIRKNKKPRLKKSHCNKLQNEIQKFIIRFCFYLNMKSEIQIIV